jgi:hypothetical protein
MNLARRGKRMYKVNCAWEGCEQPAKSSYSSSKSKYCNEHAPMARKAWQEARDQGNAERETKYAKFQELYTKALEAGQKAFDDAKPVPMIVQQRESAFNDSSEVIQEWVIDDGVCGFAWLTIRPGNSSFAHWAKKNAGASKAYGGGLSIWSPVGGGSQSMERKQAGVYAMADILMEGLSELDSKTSVYGQSRMD